MPAAMRHQEVPRSRPDEVSGVVAPSLLRPVFLRMGVVENRTPTVYNRHQHTGYEIIFVDEGVYYCVHNETPVTLHRNDLLIIKPGDWHMDRFDGRYVRYFGISFRLQMAQGMPLSLFREGTPTRRQRFRARRRDFMPIMKKIIAEAQVSDFVSAHLQDTLVLEFFYRMVRQVPRDILSDYFLEASEEASFSARLLGLLNGRLTRTVRVPELARLMGMSESSLAHKTRQIMKCAPLRLFARLKMQRAMTLLTSTDMSVKEVGAYLSFQDPCHFSRAFKRAFGEPPSEVKAHPSRWTAGA